MLPFFLPSFTASELVLKGRPSEGGKRVRRHYGWSTAMRHRQQLSHQEMHVHIHMHELALLTLLHHNTYVSMHVHPLMHVHVIHLNYEP